MITDKLRELIAKAEEEHLTAGVLVEVCADNLEEARKKARICRNKWLALIDLLHNTEKEDSSELHIA